MYWLFAELRNTTLVCVCVCVCMCVCWLFCSLWSYCGLLLQMPNLLWPFMGRWSLVRWMFGILNLEWFGLLGVRRLLPGNESGEGESNCSAYWFATLHTVAHPATLCRRNLSTDIPHHEINILMRETGLPLMCRWFWINFRVIRRSLDYISTKLCGCFRISSSRQPSSSPRSLTFWSRNYFLKFSTPVYKVWIIQEPNKLELWNKLHFEEEKTESIYHF